MKFNDVYQQAIRELGFGQRSSPLSRQQRRALNKRARRILRRQGVTNLVTVNISDSVDGNLGR